MLQKVQAELRQVAIPVLPLVQQIVSTVCLLYKYSIEYSMSQACIQIRVNCVLSMYTSVYIYIYIHVLHRYGSCACYELRVSN